ncbi:MAG: VWA domain-containing protein [Vicinamibacterales bacterium]
MRNGVARARTAGHGPSGIVAAAVLAALLASPLLARQGPVFRAGTTLVTLDIVARDAAGRFVSDLQASDFTITEDGVIQRVESFVMVQGGRTLNLLTPPPAAAAEGLILPPARPAPASSGRVVVVIVDDLHIEAEYTPHVRRLVQTLTSSLLHEGDQVAMVSTGPSSIDMPLTGDLGAVRSAASRIRGSGLTAAEIFQMPETSQGAGDLRRRAQLAFQTAYRTVAALDAVRGRRKVVLLISSGYDLDPFAAGRASADRVQGGRFADPVRALVEKDNPYQRLPAVTADLDLLAYLRELTLTANRANATLYPVDPRGLTGVVDAGRYLDQSDWRTVVQKNQSSLGYLAEQTGGRAVINVNDFAAEFRRIDAETSDYYLVGYTSTNPDASKRVRTVDARVGRPGVTVTSRSAYSVAAAAGPASR